MRFGAVLVAVAAAAGSFLQGWDSSTIAGSLIYIKREFNLQSQPTLEGLIVATSLIGGTIITTFSGPVSDKIGRRPVLIISSISYFVAGLIVLWSPNVPILLLGRLLDGFGVGLTVTMVPIYISETSPSEIRGQLNTLPQFLYSGGMFLAYCLVFGMSLMDSPSWRLMLAVISIPSACYLAFTVLFLPESPRWLVSKGKIDEAKHVLQRLRGREDVSGELALLIEGLGIGRNATIKEYIIKPANESTGNAEEKSGVKLYGLEGGVSWIANPVTGENGLGGMISRQGSMANRSMRLTDPLVTLFGSVHDNLPAVGSPRCMIASTMSMPVNEYPDGQSDDENQIDGDENVAEHVTSDDSSEDIRVPFLPHNKSSLGKNTTSHSILNAGEETVMGIGSGWQLAYKFSEKEGVLQRIFLHQEGVVGSRQGSFLSAAGVDSHHESEFIQAAALISEPAICSREVLSNQDGSVTIHPAEDVTSGPSWRELLEPGVKRALVVGVGLQILQQVSGINGVLFYGPQILEQAGVADLLSNLGLSASSAPLFISLLTALLMLPCIIVSMRLMDVSGRRFLMLSTVPILIVSLLALLISNITNMGSVLQATISTVSLMIYTSCFMMGIGPIPNILCSEIFPTRVRGMCITICALTYWIGNIIVTYSLPVLLSSIGLVGVFTIYAIGCLVTCVFVFLKVPETKGMPLEVISEFFALGASQIGQNSKMGETKHPRGTV